jgi:hypothetical protein
MVRASSGESVEALLVVEDVGAALVATGVVLGVDVVLGVGGGAADGPSPPPRSARTAASPATAAASSTTTTTSSSFVRSVDAGRGGGGAGAVGSMRTASHGAGALSTESCETIFLIRTEMVIHDTVLLWQ